MTTPTSVIGVLPEDPRDRTLIKLLLAHLARHRGRQWVSLDFPEERIHSRDAVQVIAMEQNGRATAIEHAALDGFAGDAHEGARFAAVFDALERDQSLRVQGYHIEVAVPIEAVPARLDVKLLAAGVRGWCERHVKSAPEGRSTHVIMVSRMPLRIRVEKTATPGEAGRLSMTHAQPPRNFQAVVQDRLQHKLGRVAAASADQKILLFERKHAVWSLAQLRLELEGASLEFPDLNGLTEVWMADSVGWETDGRVEFLVVLRNEAE